MFILLEGSWHISNRNWRRNWSGVLIGSVAEPEKTLKMGKTPIFRGAVWDPKWTPDVFFLIFYLIYVQGPQKESTIFFKLRNKNLQHVFLILMLIYYIPKVNSLIKSSTGLQIFVFCSKNFSNLFLGSMNTYL